MWDSRCLLLHTWHFFYNYILQYKLLQSVMITIADEQNTFYEDVIVFIVIIKTFV